MAISDWNQQDLQDFIDKSSYEELLEMFQEDFNASLDVYEGNDITVCGCTFTPSYVLERCDEIAYRESFLNFIDFLVGCANE